MNPLSNIAVWFTRLTALTVLAVAALKLAAWHYHWLDLLRFGAPAALMQFNTALGFILSALTLLGVGKRRRRWVIVLPSLVFALGVLTGLEHLTGRSLGIDSLFFRPYIDDRFSPGGRMVASSALAFTCTGAALLIWLSGLKPHWRFMSTSTLVALVGLLGLMNLTGYADSGGVGYGWHGFVGMAVATAWLFVFLAFGLAATIWQGYLTAGAGVKMIAVPFVVLLLGLTATLVIIQTIYVGQAQTAAAAADRDAFDFARIIQLESARDLKLITRLQARWQGGMPRAVWEQDTMAILRDNRTINAAALIDPSLNITRDLAGAGSVLLREAVTQNAPALHALKPDDRFMMDGTSGNTHIVIFILPLRRAAYLDGYVAVAYDVQGLLNNVVSNGWSRPVQLSVIGHNGTLAAYPAGTSQDPAAMTREIGIDFARDRWTIRVSEIVQGSVGRGLILLVLFTGVILSAALSIALYQQARLRRGGAALQETATRLRTREEELTRLNKDLEQFAYVASHDLKAPLRGIDNLTQWIVEDLADGITPSVQEKTGLLRRRVSRLEKLLDDILAYSRAGRIVENSTDIDVWSLIQDIAVDLPAGFTVQAETALPVLFTPRTPLHQVFQNLFVNAVKHHDEAAGIITITAVERKAFYEFAVTDDGPGIPEIYREKVFDMFRTLKPRDQVEGSGLGLSIVKKLIEWQKGRIWIAECLDAERGTAMHFLWPKRS